VKKLKRLIVNKSVKILVLLLLLTSSFKGYGQDLSYNITDVKCYGASTGIITVTTSNCGTGPFKYQITGPTGPNSTTFLSPQVGNTTYSFPNLSAGTYSVTCLVLSNGNWVVCKTVNGIPVAQNDLYNVTTSVTQPTCNVANAFNGNNLGSALITVNGADPGGCFLQAYGYNVSWTGPVSGGNHLSDPREIITCDKTLATNTLAINSLPDGIYTLEVRDNWNCPYSTVFTISQPPAISPTITPINIPCNGGSGSVGISNLNASDGTPGNGFNISWSGASSGNPNGSTPEITPPSYTNYTINPLGVGTYSVTVNDGNNCVFTQNNIQITQPPALQVTSSVEPALCFNQASGSAIFTVEGGVPGYNISWTGPTPGSPAGVEIAAAGGSYTAPNLAAGDYVFTITDNGGGCSATVTLTITQPPSALSISTTPQNILCFGANNGSILVYGTGGTPQGNSPVNGYNVSWSGQASGNPAGIEIPTDNPNIISGYYTIGSLAPGNYVVTLTDVNNCTSVANITITQPPQVFLSQEQVNNNCFTGQTGSINLTVVGGTPFGGVGGTYQYLWSNTQTTQDVNNLPNGVYSVVVTDANACQTSFPNITITSPPALVVTASTTQPICYNQTGAINVTVTGGIQGYTYVWSNGSTTQDLSNLTAGSYTITVMDANGCTTTGTWVINAAPPALTMTLSPTHPLCHNAANGSILVTVNGGVPTYSISGTAPLSRTNNYTKWQWREQYIYLSGLKFR
jgi:large repetitive protein